MEKDEESDEEMDKDGEKDEEWTEDVEERWAEMCEDVCTTCGSCLGTEGRGWTGLQHTHVRSLRWKISELWLAKSYFLFGAENREGQLK